MLLSLVGASKQKVQKKKAAKTAVIPMGKRKRGFLARNALLKRNVFNAILTAIVPAQKAGFIMPAQQKAAKAAQ